MDRYRDLAGKHITGWSLFFCFSCFFFPASEPGVYLSSSLDSFSLDIQ